MPHGGQLRRYEPDDASLQLAVRSFRPREAKPTATASAAGDDASLVLAQRSFAAKPPAAVASATATMHYYLPVSNGDETNPSIVFYEGEAVYSIENTFP